MIRNTTETWGNPAKLLHWIGAALILALLVHGWWMTHLVPREGRLVNYAWHAALGYDLLALTVLRLLWRWRNETPAAPPGLTARERLAAKIGHWALYVLMLAATVSGWGLAGTFRNPLDAKLLGLIEMPAIASAGNRALHEAFEEAHEFLAYALAVFVIGHVVAAIRHHVVKKNDVLRRMSFVPRN